MRILHTADWPLGRTLCGRSLLEAQAWFLHGPFLEAVRDTLPDLVVVAGDVYDRSVPPADAVELLDDILAQVVLGLRVPMVIIPGNHDDPRRLGFASGLLRGRGSSSARALSARPSASPTGMAR